MSDPDQPGEDFDDELLAGDYPPDEPLGVEEDGVTELEELGGESFAERDERTQPEEWELADETGPGPATGVDLIDDDVELGEDDAGESRDEGLVGQPVGGLEDLGPLAPDDEFSGDETTRDVVTERTPPPAEVAAVHIEDEGSPEPD
jgi:hypothetical protein